jgi:hypothetical protein
VKQVLKKMTRVVLFASIFFLNMAAFQNCSKLQSDSHFASIDPGQDPVQDPAQDPFKDNGPVNMNPNDCDLFQSITYKSGELQIILKKQIDSRKSLNLNTNVDSQAVTWERVIPSGINLPLRIGQIYQAGQSIKVNLTQVVNGSNIVQCQHSISYQVPSVQQFQLSRFGSSPSEFPDQLFWENNRLYLNVNRPDPSAGISRYFAVEHSYLSTTQNRQVNTLKRYPVPLNYPLHVTSFDVDGALNYWDLSGQGGHKYSRQFAAVYLAFDSTYKGWSPELNKVKYCEPSSTKNQMPKNKFFGLQSQPVECNKATLMNVGYTALPGQIEGSSGMSMFTLTPNTVPHTPDADTGVRNLSNDQIIAMANDYSKTMGSSSLVMFDFEHNSNHYSETGTGEKFALLAKTFQDRNPQAIVVDWFQSPGFPSVSSVKDIDGLKPLLEKSALGENSPFYKGIDNLNIYNQTIKLNSEFTARYSSINNARYVDAVTALNIQAYAPNMQGAQGDEHRGFIPDIIYSSRMSKAHFPNKKAICTGWWLVEPMMKDPFVFWTMEQDGDVYETPGRNTISADFAREKTLWCMLEGDGYYGWDGMDNFGHGKPKPSMYDHAFNFRWYLPSENKWVQPDVIFYNGQKIDAKDGFPGFGWSKSNPSQKVYRSQYPLHQHDYYVKAATEISNYRYFIDNGVKQDLATGLTAQEAASKVVDAYGNEILTSTKQNKPFAVGFKLASGQTLVAVRYNQGEFGVRTQVHVKVGSKTVQIPVFGNTTTFQIVGE